MRLPLARSFRRLSMTALLVASAAALAACQSTTASLDSMNTASTAPASYKETAELGKKWQRDTGNVATGLAYANGLEAIGQNAQQLEVLRTLTSLHPEDAKLAVIYGKKLVNAGRGSEAIPLLQPHAAAPGADWRLHNALGSAYDQQGDYTAARENYAKALAQSPDEMSVLNNMGMSFALEGNLKQAEDVLRKASQLPRAASQPRIRQNLALVVGLQGRFDEARKIASEDLPPDQVEANMDYLQKMLSQPNTWQQLSNSG